MQQDVPAPHSEGNDKYMRLKEAAAAMSVSYLWLWKRVQRGEGPPGTKRRGSMYLIPRDGFEAWCEQDNIS